MGFRDVGASGEAETFARRIEDVREGSSEVEEFAVEAPPLVTEDPWRRDGGGGGGTFWNGDEVEDGMSLGLGILGVSSGNSDMECREEVVRFEPLRERFPPEDVRSWLCLRASGTGGGIFFDGAAWGFGGDGDNDGFDPAGAGAGSLVRS